MAILFVVCTIYNFRIDRKIDKIIRSREQDRKESTPVPSPIETAQTGKDNATLETISELLRSRAGDKADTQDKEETLEQ